MEIKTLPHGQVVLPLEICRRLGIEAGMRLEVELDEKTGCIRLRPLNSMSTYDREGREEVKLKQKPPRKLVK